MPSAEHWTARVADAASGDSNDMDLAKWAGGCHCNPMTNTAPLLALEDDDAEVIRLQAMIDEARAAEDAGETIPHEVVREWLLALARGEQIPPPLS